MAGVRPAARRGSRDPQHDERAALLGGDDLAALNFYAPGPAQFDDLDVGTASIFAPFAALAVHQEVHDRDVANLGAALTSSRQIGTAVGILMSRHRISAEVAFDLLRGASQHLNRKLRDITEEVESTGELPASCRAWKSSGGDDRRATGRCFNGNGDGP